jgi:transmembrane sensor
LFSGERVRAGPQTPLEKLKAGDATKLVSWREGKLHFEDDSLSVVIGEVNRYSDSKFVIDDPSVQNLTLTGVFRTGDTASVLFALGEAYGLKGEREGNVIRIGRGGSSQKKAGAVVGGGV